MAWWQTYHALHTPGRVNPSVISHLLFWRCMVEFVSRYHATRRMDCKIGKERRCLSKAKEDTQLYFDSELQIGLVPFIWCVLFLLIVRWSTCSYLDGPRSCLLSTLRLSRGQSRPNGFITTAREVYSFLHDDSLLVIQHIITYIYHIIPSLW